MIISTSDNVKLNVQKTGEGTAVLFLHEFGGDQRSWKPQINYVEEYYQEDIYIDSISKIIKNKWAKNNRKLIFSYHGLPKNT